MTTNITNPTDAAEKIGWQSQPNGRGTIDILWSCLLTIFLCTWSVLSLNVPLQGTSSLAFMRRKMKWMLIAGLGPEWLTGLAGGQWSIAYHSTKKIRALGHKWTMKQSYFADMGGIRLKLKDDEFPITSNMLFKLLEMKVIDLPKTSESTTEDRSKVDLIAKPITTLSDVSKREIEDRSKVDLIAKPITILPDISKRVIEDRSKVDLITKLITIIQTLWFVAQCGARLKQGLDITTLELSTVAFVVCTFGTMLMWWCKPMDVMVPVVISDDRSLADLIETVPSISWASFPIKELDTLRPNLHGDVLPKLEPLMFWKRDTALSEKQKQDKEKARLRNDRLPPEKRDWYMTVILTTVSILFGATYMAGWNIDFPTMVELIFWRVAICSMLGGVVAFWAVDYGMELYFLCRHRPMDAINTFRIAVCGVIATVYVCGRLFLIVEMFVSLRELPVSAYETVNWTLSLLHVS